MKTATSDPIAEFEAEAQRQGVSWRALLKSRAAAEHITEGQFYERLLKSSGAVRLRESARAPRPHELEKAFESLGHSAKGARIAAAGRSGLREVSLFVTPAQVSTLVSLAQVRMQQANEVTKHEVPGGDEYVIDDTSFEGGDFKKGDYAYTPSDDPDTWQLLLTMTPGGKPDPTFVRTAVMAIDPANQSVTTVAIPDDDLPGVLAKIATAWKAAIPDEALPAILTAEAAAFLALGFPFVGLSAAVTSTRYSRRP